MKRKAIHIRTQLAELFRTMNAITIYIIHGIDFVEVVEVEPEGKSTNKNYHLQRDRLAVYEGSRISTVSPKSCAFTSQTRSTE